MNNGKRHIEYGFTMVEMAIVILIMGMVVGSVFTFLTNQQNQKNYQKTVDNQQKVAVALAIFAENYNRLPCPATQDRLVTDNTYGVEEPNCPNLKGIVPFRTLGLDPRDILDGYNHALTYVVSEAASSSAAPGSVYPNCRDANWVPVAGTNLNPGKASFCCKPVLNNQLEVYNHQDVPNGALLIGPQSVTSVADSVTIQGTANTTDNLAYVAYLLISHGSEGGGYYILPSGTDRYPQAQPLNEQGEGETQNGNGTADPKQTDLKFVAMPTRRVTGINHFDDVVLWRTQQQVMAELHNNSCRTP